MNELSATTIASATTAAAFASALVLAILSRPAPPPVSEPQSSRFAALDGGLRAPAGGVRAATPMLDCDLFAPADPAIHEPPAVPLLAAAPATKTETAPPAGGDAPRSGTGRDPQRDAECNPEAELPNEAGSAVGGLGSGWIISADGVMQMNPYGLSDAHSITVRPAEPLREFKGRVIGLGPPHGVPREADAPRQDQKRRPLLVVADDAAAATDADSTPRGRFSALASPGPGVAAAAAPGGRERA